MGDLTRNGVDPAMPAVGRGDAGAGRPAVRLAARVLALLLVPCAALVAGEVVERAGAPRWVGANYDPDYPYLFNAVNIAEGRAPHHIHHPGTSLQVFGAVVLMVRHLTDGPGVPLRRDALADPEGALDALSLALRVVHAAALLALGVAGARLTGSVVCAVIAQGATLLSLTTITSLHRVTPEPLLLSVSLVLSASVLMCLSRARPVRTRFAVISGVGVAVGLATKVTFAPAALAVWGVLVWPRPRERRLPLVHLATVALALPILLIPIWGRLGSLIGWLKGLAVNDGHYGSSTGHLVVNTDTYARDLWVMIAAHPVTAGVAFCAALLAGALFVPRLARRLDDPGRRARAALAAVAAAQVLQFLLVAKHAAPRHVIPAVGLSGLAVCLAFVLTRGVLPARARWAAVAIAVAGLALGGVGVFRGVAWSLPRMRGGAAREVALARDAERLASKPGAPGSGAVLVYTYWTSSPAYALLFADYWSGSHSAADLRRRYPDRLLYNWEAEQPFTGAGGVVVARGEVQAWAAEGRVYFQMWERHLPKWLRYDRVARSGPGGLYRARLPDQDAR